MEQVHRVLGRHRPDDVRSGWISGLDEEEGARHPTAGGLRIGKELPEREPGESMDPRLEWDRDGQYFHYLTRWMHALLRMWEETGERRYLRQGLELARAAFRGFVRAGEEHAGGVGAARVNPASVRMIWKASLDLSRALVDSQGHHDPLDGWITLRTLQAAREEAEEGAPAGVPRELGRRNARTEPAAAPLPDLRRELTALEPLVRSGGWATNDALGIGGLLVDVHRVVRLEEAGHPTLPGLPHRLCQDGVRSLEALTRHEPFRMPGGRRLPFRELGLSLGLRGVERIDPTGGSREACLAELARFLPLADPLETFWSEDEHRAASTWADHLDINRVSLAASLVPEGWFGR